MAFNNIAMEARTIIDAQYAIHAADDAANDAANDRSHGTSIVLADPGAMGGAVRYALRVCAGDCKRRNANEYDLSKSWVSLLWG